MSEKLRSHARKSKVGNADRKGVRKTAPKKNRAGDTTPDRKRVASKAGPSGKKQALVGRRTDAQTVTLSTGESEKLQKVLARAGFGSRREIEDWIVQGRVRVNQHPATLGDRVTAQDRISVDGKSVSTQRLFATPQRVILYNKDFGSVCTRADPEQRKTIFEDLPRLKRGRWISIGRLDINTSGLLLLTTDGELANRLMHPSFEVEREYLVRVLGQVDDAILQRLQQGVMLDDGEARFDQIKDIGGEGANHWYRVMLREGRKREVRRLWESQGVQVSRLTRIRFGNIEIPRRLQRGKWQELTIQQLNGLYRLTGLVSDIPTPVRSGKQKSTHSRKSALSRRLRG